MKKDEKDFKKIDPIIEIFIKDNHREDEMSLRQTKLF